MTTDRTNPRWWFHDAVDDLEPSTQAMCAALDFMARYHDQKPDVVGVSNSIDRRFVDSSTIETSRFDRNLARYNAQLRRTGRVHSR
jgi:hypothetical protein